MNGCVLVPSGGEPVCRDGGRQRAANYPAKESPTGAADDTARRVANQFVNDLRRIGTVISERATEACTKFVERNRSTDWLVLRPGEMVESMSERMFESLSVG